MKKKKKQQNFRNDLDNVATGEAQMPETVQASMKTIKDFAKRNDCEFYLLTDQNLADFINIPAD